MLLLSKYIYVLENSRTFGLRRKLCVKMYCSRAVHDRYQRFKIKKTRANVNTKAFYILIKYYTSHVIM